MKPTGRRVSYYNTPERDRIANILENEPVGTHLSIKGGRIYRKTQEDGRAWLCIDKLGDMRIASTSIATALASLGRVWAVS